MKKTLFTACLLAASSGVFAAGPHWGYSGHEGPEFWGELAPAYALCKSGRNQSPVDINAAVEAELAPLGFGYQAGGNKVTNNGHTIQVDYSPGSTLNVDGHSFELKQFHFHAPSENLIGSHNFAMEAHFVHADKEGNLAVVAVMFNEGAENAELEKVWSVMPHSKDKSAKPATTLSAEALLPKERDYYRFSGSLTTPPCSEGVVWLVMKEPLTASAAQITAFEKVMHHHNNRPVQPLNARAVLQ